MNPLIPVSLGELVDKISILNLKLFHAVTSEQIHDVTKERDLLFNILLDLNIHSSQTFKKLSEELTAVNASLWTTEDALRVCENKRQFDITFIELARSVYRLNDQRALVKRQINKHFNSNLNEVKILPHYQR